MTATPTPDEFWVLPLPKWNKSEKELSITAMSSKQTLHHVDFAGKRVLIRVDYNVPLKDGHVTDTTRIDATIPTLKSILKPSRAKVKCLVLLCHLGRPGGKFNKDEFSLAPVVPILQEHLSDLAKVKFLPECVGPEVEDAINNCEEGTVFLLENLRFHIEETGKGVSASGEKVKAEPEAVDRFREALTRLGDVFVFEAFGAAHRPHSSVVGIDIPQRVAGKLMHRELSYFSQVLGRPKLPFLCIIGGAKVSDKIQVIENILDLANEVIIGGGMAYTFKKVIDGVEIGKSLFDEQGAELVPQIMERAKARNVKMHFPVDHVCADSFSADAQTRVVTDEEGVPEGWMALDCGPESRRRFGEVMERASTILWNGPLGVFEMEPFADGTRSAMEKMVECTHAGATTVIGGGDTGAASHKFSYDGRPVFDQVSHVSTGGGSSLVMMEGKMLPGVDMLSSVTELPPENISLQDLWQHVNRVEHQNEQLRNELRELKLQVSKLAASS